MENTAYSGREFSYPESRCASVARVLAKSYIGVVEVDLCTGNASILKSSEDPECNGRELPWGDLTN